MAALTHRPGLPLWSDYTSFVRRHRLVVAVLVNFGLLVGLAWGMMQPATYSATASVALAQVPVYVMRSTGELVPPEVSIDTDAQLLHSPAVLGAVAEALGVDDAAASDRLSVTASPSSHVLHVTVASTSARRAADAANAAVTALIDVRRQALGSLRLDELRQLRLLLSTQERELGQEQSSRLVILANDELFASILELRTSLDELEDARRQPAEIVSSARPPTAQDHPNTEVPVTSGAMLGLLAGCLVGVVRDRTRPDRQRPTSTYEPSALSGLVPAAALRTKDYDHAS
jgi:uncharacterized protein involved in exopolysaccharide biosynthesis